MKLRRFGKETRNEQKCAIVLRPWPPNKGAELRPDVLVPIRWPRFFAPKRRSKGAEKGPEQLVSMLRLVLRPPAAEQGVKIPFGLHPKF